jgi:hypothetical protein
MRTGAIVFSQDDFMNEEYLMQKKTGVKVTFKLNAYNVSRQSDLFLVSLIYFNV